MKVCRIIFILIYIWEESMVRRIGILRALALRASGLNWQDLEHIGATKEVMKRAQAIENGTSIKKTDERFVITRYRSIKKIYEKKYPKNNSA